MPKLDDIPDRPGTPVVIRFIGGAAEIVGVNQDFFTVGDSADCDVKFPTSLTRDGRTLFRIGRAAEGWRLHCPSGAVYYLNQEIATRTVSLRSGDVIRLTPGGPGMQFNILNQNSEPLSKLTARYAPRLAPSAPDIKATETTPIPAAGSNAYSKSSAGRAEEPSHRPRDKKDHAASALFPSRSIGFKDWENSTKFVLIVLLALLAIASVLSFWPPGDAAPSENAPPPFTKFDDANS